jgi:DNA-directed RNA polymerase subunit N (RpoN/RPB10)
MHNLATALIWALALIALPVIICARIGETRTETAQRLHQQGYSQRAIAARLGVSRYSVQRMLQGVAV